MPALLIRSCLLAVLIAPVGTSPANGGDYCAPFAGYAPCPAHPFAAAKPGHDHCGPFDWLKRKDRRVQCHIHCHVDPRHKVKQRGLREPPRGMVVQSVPALLVAQQAIAIEPAAFRAHAVACDQEVAMKKFTEAFIQRLEERQAQAKSQAQAHGQSQQTPEQRIEALERQLDRIEELMKGLGSQR